MPKHDKKVTHLKGAKKLKKAEHLKYCKQEKAKQTKEQKHITQGPSQDSTVNDMSPYTSFLLSYLSK